MSCTPKTDQIESIYWKDDDFDVIHVFAFARDLERELNAAKKRIKQLEQALDCVVVSCSYFHHSKKHQHEYGQPCPVEDLIRKAKEAKP